MHNCNILLLRFVTGLLFSLKMFVTEWIDLEAFSPKYH